jgi:hypothetical protein
MEEIINRLFEMQSTENDGRGISAVRELVKVLRDPDHTQEQIKTAIYWDWDKIANYPEIADFIKKNIYNDALLYIVGV